MSDRCMHTQFVVNGETVDAQVPVRMHLVDYLREDLGLTGSHLGCEHGVCGACQVMVDGQLVRGCLTLAVQANGNHRRFIGEWRITSAASRIFKTQCVSMRFLLVRYVTHCFGNYQASPTRHTR